VVLGFPGPELESQAERGEVVLGGCRILGEELDPAWACLACREQYTRAEVGLPSRRRRR
jgi:hypothetical protein